MEIIVTHQADGLEGQEVWVQVRSDDINMKWDVARQGLDIEQQKLVDECKPAPVLWHPDPLDGGPENAYRYEDWYILQYEGA